VYLSKNPNGAAIFMRVQRGNPFTQKLHIHQINIHKIEKLAKLMIKFILSLFTMEFKINLAIWN